VQIWKKSNCFCRCVCVNCMFWRNFYLFVLCKLCQGLGMLICILQQLRLCHGCRFGVQVLLDSIISVICYLYVCMFECDVCGLFAICNKGSVRQSSYIESKSTENTMGMLYLKIRTLATVVVYSWCVWVQGYMLFASSTY
jgi:hypothetical protein